MNLLAKKIMNARGRVNMPNVNTGHIVCENMFIFSRPESGHADRMPISEQDTSETVGLRIN